MLSYTILINTKNKSYMPYTDTLLIIDCEVLIENASKILLCAAVPRIPELMANYKKLHDQHTKDWIKESKSIAAINDHLQDRYQAALRSNVMSPDNNRKIRLEF